MNILAFIEQSIENYKNIRHTEYQTQLCKINRQGKLCCSDTMEKDLQKRHAHWFHPMQSNDNQSSSHAKEKPKTKEYVERHSKYGAFLVKKSELNAMNKGRFQHKETLTPEHLEQASQQFKEKVKEIKVNPVFTGVVKHV